MLLNHFFLHGIFFLLAYFALYISQLRYVATRFEKMEEKHEQVIAKIIKESLAATGERLSPRQVVQLWTGKAIWVEDYFFAVKEADDPNMVELAYKKHEPKN